MTRKYTWVITRHVISFESSSLELHKGRGGANDRAPLSVMIRQGERFRMFGAENKAPICGYIVGEYTGLEPLEDYGRAVGCTAIEYKRGGKWVRADARGTRTESG